MLFHRVLTEIKAKENDIPRNREWRTKKGTS